MPQLLPFNLFNSVSIIFLIGIINMIILSKILLPKIYMKQWIRILISSA